MWLYESPPTKGWENYPQELKNPPCFSVDVCGHVIYSSFAFVGHDLNRNAIQKSAVWGMEIIFKTISRGIAYGIPCRVCIEK